MAAHLAFETNMQVEYIILEVPSLHCVWGRLNMIHNKIA